MYVCCIYDQKYGDLEGAEDKDGIHPDAGMTTPVFQSLLMNFLDTRAPVLGKNTILHHFLLLLLPSPTSCLKNGVCRCDRINGSL